MTPNRFKPSDLLAAVGATAAIVSGFLPWISAKASLGSVTEELTQNGWDFRLTGLVAIAATIGCALLLLITSFGNRKADPKSSAMIALAAGAIAVVLIVIRLIDGWEPADSDAVREAGATIEITRELGIFVGLGGAVLATAAAFIAFSSSGGNLRDFTDGEKLRHAYSDSRS